MKKKYFFVVILNIFTLNINAQITTSLSQIRDKSDLDIGFNRRSDVGNWWSDNSFIDRLAEMNPDILRYPGGTQANYWDWRTGKFLDSTNKAWNNKEIVRIPEFLNALPNRTKVIYVVNMARPTPATGISVNAPESVLKSNATLNAKVQDMLDAIAEFDSHGKLPYAIELGNEFYFGNEEGGIFHIIEEIDGWHSGWDYANNQSFISADKKTATEINAKFYLDQCKVIVNEINNIYPSIKFALVTAKKGNGNSSRDHWNNTIFNELANNPAYTDLQSHIYAVTQHHYLNTNYGDQTVIFDDSSAKTAIAEGIQYPMDKQADYDLVPNNYKIWYTEYGVSKDNAVETWATGLRYGALIISWLNRGDKVGQLDYHYVSKNDVIKVSSPMKLAPIGITAELLTIASADMDKMQEIIFDNNPISINGINSLYGYKFKNNEKETLFIININDTDLQVDTSNLFSYNGQYTLTQYYSNAPYVSGVYKGHPNIISNISNVNSDTFTAKKFSITTIEIRNDLLSSADNPVDKFSTYPNPVTNILYLDNSISTLKKIFLFDISGRKYKISVNKTNKSIDVSNLKTGVYFLKTPRKIIKIIKL